MKKIKNKKKTYYEHLHANKLGNLEEMDAFLENQKLSKLEHEEIENLSKANNESSKAPQDAKSRAR